MLTVISCMHADLQDFDNSVITITFQPDEIGVRVNDIETPVPIVDDTIDEAEEQYFVVTLDIVGSHDGVVITLQDALCRITDNDGK